MRNGKPFIYSISGFQDDPENEMFWFLFTSKDEMKEELQPTTKKARSVPVLACAVTMEETNAVTMRFKSTNGDLRSYSIQKHF
ncbi:hypothetical protein CDAR_623041 [Caerostris darwini]|uniref:Uncharacterized protein n=1 Tax=Caerostris darwini TaxID=1538125 RepID=A0AAV4SRW5_9ARAC|nr:hypothetical protein CDAR_623041 [Caerostris darwini]